MEDVTDVTGHDNAPPFEVDWGQNPGDDAPHYFIFTIVYVICHHIVANQFDIPLACSQFSFCCYP